MNSKNANLGGAQTGGGPLHQTSHQSNSLGRDSLKSAGGIVNFDQAIGSGIAGGQGPGQQKTMAGRINQQQNNMSSGGASQKMASAQYGRQPAANAMGNANGNSFKLNQMRDNSK
jgi:hypothetical protein